jgi:hypothetical protein
MQEWELMVTPLTGKPFVVEQAGESGKDQALGVIRDGAIEVHSDGSWTIHPPHQIKSVKIQKRGTWKPRANRP